MDIGSPTFLAWNICFLSGIVLCIIVAVLLGLGQAKATSALGLVRNMNWAGQRCGGGVAPQIFTGQ